MLEHDEGQPRLEPGVHGTREEILFVESVLKEIRRAGYEGPIWLVGSRAKRLWISRSTFGYIRSELPNDDSWYRYLNKLAKAERYNRSEIPLLADKIPSTSPEIIFEFLEEEYGEAGSDFDLRITHRPSGIEVVSFVTVGQPGVVTVYQDFDYGTGQTVDVWAPEDVV